MLTEERVEVIFGEMDTYVLELSNDPGSLGDNYFQDIIATCRNYLNRVSLVISELNREKLTVSSELLKLEAVLSLEYDDLLANSERVRGLSSVDDRKATVGYLLRERQGKINELRDQKHMLEAVYKVVAHRNRELHSTMTAIKDQRRLMRIDLNTGAFYGDERIPRFRSPSGGMGVENEDLNEAELTALLAESGSELESEAAKAESEAAESVGVEADSTQVEQDSAQKEVSEEDVINFLESPEEEVLQPVVEPKQPDTTSNTAGDEVEDILALLEDM